MNLQLSNPEKTARAINRVAFGISLLAVMAVIYDSGFSQPARLQRILQWIYVGSFGGGLASVGARYLLQKKKRRPEVVLFDVAFSIYLIVTIAHFLGLIRFVIFDEVWWIHVSVFLVFFREFSAINTEFYQRLLNPAQLFIASFFGIILLGAFLLLLPRATHTGLSFIDALFTSTSAVCVTGLIVVDTGSYFTELGQLIILLLIQAGGIGIMTFTSYFSYFFRGGASYENQLMLKDLTNSEKIGEVFSTVRKIIILTFAIEGVGAGLIFLQTGGSLFSSLPEHVFFSVFHAVSAFCNAGFSTLPNSLYEPAFRFNYPLHLIIAILFIIGGIGFPIAFNFFRYLRHFFVSRFFRREIRHLPWIIHLNSRIVLITSGALLVVGTLLFLLFEYDNTLAEHRGIGKLVVAFFGAATPRTAGFNSVDTSALNLATLMVVFLLMWIGASPGSTGGGIKTTTFAVATLNFLSVARGKDRLEVFHREVSGLSVQRAFATISLSLIVIGVSLFFIAAFDPDKELLDIAFETFSAYSTVGLSLGITADLSPGSKLVLIATMFIGRVGMLTLLVAFLRRIKSLKYRYPSEDIMIN